MVLKVMNDEQGYVVKNIETFLNAIVHMIVLNMARILNLFIVKMLLMMIHWTSLPLLENVF